MRPHVLLVCLIMKPAPFRYHRMETCIAYTMQKSYAASLPKKTVSFGPSIGYVCLGNAHFVDLGHVLVLFACSQLFAEARPFMALFLP